MANDELSALSYPRYLHRDNGHKDHIHGDALLVQSADEAEAAVKDGWSVEAFPPAYDKESGAPVAATPEPAKPAKSAKPAK